MKIFSDETKDCGLGHDTGISSKLKPVFEHFRNMFICAGLLFVGLSAISGSNVLWGFIGTVICGIAGLLATLNSLDVFQFFRRELRPIRFKGRKRAILIGPFVIVVYASIVFLIISVIVEARLA